MSEKHPTEKAHGQNEVNSGRSRSLGGQEPGHHTAPDIESAETPAGRPPADALGGRAEMIPASLIPKDQLWFWTPEWQKKGREAEREIARGNVKTAESPEQLLRELKQR
jgi:hypothetical protein